MELREVIENQIKFLESLQQQPNVSAKQKCAIAMTIVQLAERLNKLPKKE